MIFNKLFALIVGVFFCASPIFADEAKPDEKLHKAANEFQSLFKKQASEMEWKMALERISLELFGPEFNRQPAKIPSIPIVCACTGLGIWSATTRTRGGIATVQAWIYRVVDGEKLLTPWTFEFVFRNGRWYLIKYS